MFELPLIPDEEEAAFHSSDDWIVYGVEWLAFSKLASEQGWKEKWSKNALRCFDLAKINKLMNHDSINIASVTQIKADIDIKIEAALNGFRLS